MDNEDRLQRGEQAFAAGDYRAAIINAKNVLIDEPDNVRGRLLLGRASLEDSDGPSAEKELRRAIRLGTPAAHVAPEMARALVIQGKFQEVLDEVPLEGLVSSDAEASVRVSRGDAYLGLDQPEAAREAFSSALELQSENLDARLGVVSSFVAEENFVQARGAIDRVLEAHPDNPRGWLYSGSLNLSLRELESAEANFIVALELADSQQDVSARLEAQAGLAEILLQQGNVDAARVYVEQLVAVAPNSLETKVLTASIAANDKDWATAQLNLQQVLQLEPDYRPAQILLGAVHLESGNLSQAEMYLSAAVAAEPDDITARQMLAETQLQLQKADAAQQALAPILKGSSADSITLQMAARASLGRRDISSALDFLRRGVKENPRDVNLQFQLAYTLIEAGIIAEAQSILDAIDVSGSEQDAYRRDALGVLTAMKDRNAWAALKTARLLAENYSDRSEALNLLGAAELANQNIQGARASFERATILDSSDVVSRRYLAEIEESIGDLASAAARYKSVLADQPDAAWAMFALGRIAFYQENYQGAVESFNRAYEADPDNPDFRFGLAKAQKQLGKPELAQSTLGQDIEGSLDHLPSAVMLGMLKAESGNLEGALEIAKRLQERYPGDPAPYAFEGEVHLIKGNPAFADELYQKALSIGPVQGIALRAFQIKRQLGMNGAEQPLVDYLENRPLDNDVRLVLAEAYLQMEDLSKSISTYEQVVSEDPVNVVALNNLAWNYYLVDDPRALETAKKAYDAMPDNGVIADTLGWIMLEQGAVEDGERLLRQAIEMDQGHQAEIRYHHAVALSKLGKMDEAQRALSELLAGDEEFASRMDAERLLAEL